jgi:hypothetical protein
MRGDFAMTAPAPAIKKEIRHLIDIQIRVFGQRSPLTPFELKDYRRRAERIKLLGQELDRISLRSISDKQFRNSS